MQGTFQLNSGIGFDGAFSNLKRSGVALAGLWPASDNHAVCGPFSPVVNSDPQIPAEILCILTEAEP